MKREKARKTAGICLVILVAGIFIAAVSADKFPGFGSFPERKIDSTEAEEIREFEDGVDEDESIGQAILENGPAESGGSNVTTDVLWDYRGYDTLGEATVLFAAVTGIAMLFRTLKEEDE